MGWSLYVGVAAILYFIDILHFIDIDKPNAM